MGTVEGMSESYGWGNQLIGKEIRKIENDGGTKYGKAIRIYLSDGKMISVRPKLDITEENISAIIQYNIGAYGNSSPKEE